MLTRVESHALRVCLPEDSEYSGSLVGVQLSWRAVLFVDGPHLACDA